MAGTDVFDLALTAPAGTPLLIERPDGHTSTTDLDWWLHRDNARPPADLAALDWAAAPGSALDIGCSTGRHLHYLQQRGITALGIDTSAAAIGLARAAGLDARLADARHFTPPGPVDTVVALGGGLGIAGTRQAADAFLARLASWLTPAGQVIVSSVDWTATADQHRAWVDDARAQGRYPGDVALRLRHGTSTGEQFDWTWIDPSTLTAVADSAGLRIAALRRFGPAWYGAVLTRTEAIQ
jgi:SAM-dependent methyltransferase